MATEDSAPWGGGRFPGKPAEGHAIFTLQAFAPFAPFDYKVDTKSRQLRPQHLHEPVQVRSVIASQGSQRSQRELKRFFSDCENHAGALAPCCRDKGGGGRGVGREGTKFPRKHSGATIQFPNVPQEPQWRSWVQGCPFATFCEKIADPLKKECFTTRGSINCPQKVSKRPPWLGHACFGSCMQLSRLHKAARPAPERRSHGVRQPPGASLWQSSKEGEMAMGQNAYPKWNPGKWNQRLKPAVSWWLYFDPYPNEMLAKLRYLGHSAR